MDAALHTIVLWSSAAAGALISATWQGAVLTAATAISLRLAPGLSAARRSLLWMAVFLIVIALYFSPFLPFAHSLASPNRTGALRADPLWGLAIAAIWGMLSLYRAAQLAWSALRLRSIARTGRSVRCNAACTQLLCSGRRPVELCTSLALDRPSVIGFRSPRILLPPALLASLSSTDLEQIILHEMEHLRRADDWTNLLQKLALVLFPLNPVLLWIEHRLCTERELACDDGVLRRTRARKAYATCLTRLAEHSIVQRGVSLALGAWERQSELSQRVYRILREPEAVMAGGRSRTVTVLLALILVAGAGELAHSPELVRFAPGAPLLAERADLAQAREAGLAPNALPAQLRMVSAVMPAGHSLAPISHTQAALLTRAVEHRRSKGLSRTRPVTVRSVILRSVTLRNGVPYVPLQPQWIVLADWQQTSAPASLRLVEQDEILPAYAALPISNGWLVFQL